MEYSKESASLSPLQDGLDLHKLYPWKSLLYFGATEKTVIFPTVDYFLYDLIEVPSESRIFWNS